MKLKILIPIISFTILFVLALACVDSPASTYGELSWSPDSKKITFDYNPRGEEREIYVINADGSEQTRLTNNSITDKDPIWSPDGKKIVFISGKHENENICVMNADGSEKTRLASGNFPTWSPDGKKIAFISYRHDKNEIYVMNADGSEQTRLTNNEITELDPSWSPDGKKIAFVVNKEIYVMNADGSEKTRLASGNFPTWSPDGKKIAFEAYRHGNLDIYVINVDGSEQTNLTDSPSSRDERPLFSPDSKKISFIFHEEPIKDENGNVIEGRTFGMYIMNIDGTEKIKQNGAHTHSWSPDGKKIAFITGMTSLRLINLDGTGLEKLTN